MLNHVRLFTIPWTAALQAFLSFTIFWSLLKLMFIESVMPSNHLVLCYPFLLLPSIFVSIRVFSNELTLHTRWPKYWSFGISPSNEYSGLISFRIDLFDITAVPGTLSTTVQKHLFFGTQPFLWPNSHICTWQLEKTIALIIWTFVSRLTSLTVVIWKQREMVALLLLVPTETRVQRKVIVWNTFGYRQKISNNNLPSHIKRSKVNFHYIIREHKQRQFLNWISANIQSLVNEVKAITRGKTINSHKSLKMTDLLLNKGLFGACCEWQREGLNFSWWLKYIPYSKCWQNCFIHWSLLSFTNLNLFFCFFFILQW